MAEQINVSTETVTEEEQSAVIMEEQAAENQEMKDEGTENIPEAEPVPDQEEAVPDPQPADTVVHVAATTELAVIKNNDRPVDLGEIATTLKETGIVVATTCTTAVKTVGKATKTAVESGARGTSDYLKRNRLTRRISGLQKAMDGICLDIGKLIYQQYLDGGTFKEEIEKLCADIKEHENEIPEIRLALAKMHGNTLCKVCGAEISEKAVFCLACGAETGVTPEAQPAEDEGLPNDAAEEPVPTPEEEADSAAGEMQNDAAEEPLPAPEEEADPAAGETQDGQDPADEETQDNTAGETTPPQE